MAAKLLFLSAFLIVQVSCGQNSLTFVIDDTSSMYDEISQVKNAAKSIVDIVLEEKASQIEEIVLVTFNDPEIKFKDKTRDEAKLKRALDSIYVHGGGDCQEMALAGIKKGLEESRPGSYVFVFTDASAKDYNKFEEIKTLCQEKQSQIVFILTGDCDDIPQPAFQVYHKIAAASNGQVFRIRKREVRQVLQYVKETIKGDKTVIASTIVPAYKWRDVQFNIDEQTEYAIVSASGTKVVLHIFDQRAHEIEGKPVTWTHNVKVIKLANLARGTYIARVRGNSEVNIMVFGRTDFTFQHGFSTTVQTNLKATDTQPTTGVKTHLMVSVQGEIHSALITEVELLNMHNQVIMRLPLTHVEGAVYKTDVFLSPEETFKISVTAKSKTTGSTVKRVAKTPVTPIQSVAPEISKTEDILKVKEGASIDVHCRIVGGKPRPQIMWYVKKQGASEFTLLKSTDEMYQVNKALTNDQYKCVAKNIRGQDEHIVTLDVQTPPNFQHTAETIMTKEGDPATIDCKLQKGSPRPRVTWQFKHKDTSEFKLISHEGEVWHIPATHLSNSGEYKCIANNIEGNDKKITKLVVKSKPTIENPTSKHSAMENSTTSLHCRAMGFPKPTVTWFYKGPHSAEYKTISKNGESLVLRNVQISDAGHYKCVAANEVGQTEHVIDVTVNAPPRIMFVPPNTLEYSGVEGDVAMKLLCSAVGYPTPTITWVVDKHTVASDKSEELYVEDNALFLINPKEIHSSSKQGHTYVCHARNDFGEATQHYEVYISTRPKFQFSPETISIMEGEPVNIDCKLEKGNPRPTVTWQFKRRDTSVFTTMSHKEEVWHFPATDLNNSGEYKCIANNKEGRDEKITKMVVKAEPTIDNPISQQSAMENTTISLRCRVRGFPEPTVNWFYKGPHSAKFEMISRNTESLLLKNIQLSNAGQYKCVAENEIGKIEKTVDVTVNAPPQIVFIPPNSPEYSGVEGDVAMKLPCTVTGYPIPTITWEVDNHVVTRDQSTALYVKNDNLYLLNPKEDHSSADNAHTYVCRATNNVGEVTQPYQVYISKYSDSSEINGTTYGPKERPYDFTCPLPFTDPNSVRWYKNYTYFTTGPTLHFEQPTEGDSGNYTCRVSDLNSATSHTVGIMFGSPPKRDQTSYKVKWSGEGKTIACYSNESPLGKYDWLYNGKKIEGVHTQSLQPIGWGQYTCQITHPLGNLALNFQVTTKDKECGIPTSFLKTEHAPLILDSSQEWPILQTSGQYLIVPHSEKLQLICQDEKSSLSNSFTKFPTTKSINATCDKEDSFKVDGVSQKITELNCKNKVTLSVVKTGKLCLGENTELKQVGFHVNGFTDVYQSCVDNIKNVPLYTKMNTIAVKKQPTIETMKSNCTNKCCYEKIQLVNAVDVSFGPAEKATFIDALNSVNYCRRNNGNWQDLEKITREQAERGLFTVWSGAANYTKVGGIWTPKYLWKVMKPHGGSEKMVVIHENTETVGPKLCAGSCGEDVVWFEPAGDRTYCCSLDDFKKAFGVPLDFN